MNRLCSLGLIALLLRIGLGGVAADAANQVLTQQKLSDIYIDQGRQAALSIAEKEHAKQPDDAETTFWVIFLSDNAGASAKGLLGRMENDAPTSSWTTLAKASTDSFDAAVLCDEAVTAAPNNPDVLNAATLVLGNEAYGATTPELLLSFFNKHSGVYDQSAGALLSEAYVYRSLGRSTDNPALAEPMLGALDRALALDETYEGAIVIKGDVLLDTKPKTAYTFLKTSAALLPMSYPVHIELWKAALAQENAAELRGEVSTDVLRLLDAAQPTTSQTFDILSTLNRNSDMQKAAEDAILKKYPNTGVADAVLLHRAMADLPLGTQEQNLEAKATALQAFINRPSHPDSHLLDEAWSNLEDVLASEAHPDPAQLYSSVEHSPDLSRGIRKLAVMKYRLPDLEKIAAKSLDDQWVNLPKEVDEQRDRKGFVHFIVGDYVNFYETSLGIIYLNEGKLDEAQLALETAIRISDSGATAHVALAQVFQGKKDYPRAEKELFTALGKSHFGEDENPALAALPELYKAEHGSTKGLDVYMKPLLEQARAERRTSILAGRIRNPKKVEEFKLKDLHGKEVNSVDLRGKIVVINFWATWCGPCRKELPEFQELYEKYKNDPKIAILAISTDSRETPDSSVSAFIDKNRYTFPVLRGKEYSEDNHINTIPLTWFLDGEGRLVFSKLGASEDLVQEFEWRIDAISQAKGSVVQTK